MRRLAWIRRLIRNLGPDEVAVYEDEVDIHLNPKIGLDWMLQGQQKEVLTPGQNQKRYLAEPSMPDRASSLGSKENARTARCPFSSFIGW